MKVALVLASVATTASAFISSKKGGSLSQHVASSKADLETIAEKANPVVKFYDPVRGGVGFGQHDLIFSILCL